MIQRKSEKSALAIRRARTNFLPLLLASLTSPAQSAEDSSSDTNSVIDGLVTDKNKTKIYYENSAQMRAKDVIGEEVGLLKFRNTLKFEHKRDPGNGWTFKRILRSFYDRCMASMTNNMEKMQAVQPMLQSYQA